jgi:hypothetical protein
LFKYNNLLGNCALICIAIVHSAACVGCARWSRPSWSSTEKAEEPKPAGLTIQNDTAPDTVSVETVLVRFDESQLDQVDQAWMAADESVIEFEHRRLLDLNGIRVGVIRGELPSSLSKQLEVSASQQRNDVVERLGLGADSDSRPKLLSCRAGRRKDLVIRRELQQPLSVVTTIGGTVSGHQFERASAILALTMYPQPNSTAIAELVPEVQFGDARKSFVASEVGLRQELKRDFKLWKQLKIRVPLSHGDVLMVSSTSPSKALGHAFFSTITQQQSAEQIVLLVRLNSTNQDDLFAEDVVDQARAIMER